MIDLSIIATYKCNLSCWFCMYSAGPEHEKFLDLEKLKGFFKTINWNQINSIGFYGGEISYVIPRWQLYIDLIPEKILRFCITNGTWSTSKSLTNDFISFVCKNNLWTKISSTKEHKKYQDIKLLMQLEKTTKGLFHIKERDDTQYRLNPMGRLYKQNWNCTFKCKRHDELMRLSDLDSGFSMKDKPYDRYAIEPDGNIIYQNCDGVYPIVSDITKPFSNLIKRCERLT